MYILAVSGGPDSMALLHKYKHKNIIVAHMNYQIRSSANRDQQIVESYCKKNNIKYFIENANELNETSEINNFQNKARIQRYKFFKTLYDKYNCTKLLLAHHKDDFIETCLMQKNSNREPDFFGIRKNIKIFDMNIFRPFVDKYWKDDILKICATNNISFGIDESNLLIDKYYRNKIRHKLHSLNLVEKEKIYNDYCNLNKKLIEVTKHINELALSWSKKMFSISFFKLIDEKYQHKILFIILHKKYPKLQNINKGLLNSLIQFIFGEQGNKKFKINSIYYIFKKANLLYFF